MIKSVEKQLDECRSGLRKANHRSAELRAALDIAERKAAGIPEGWRLVPAEPTAAMLSALARREWPEDMQAGKRLQRLRGCDVVFPKTEIECAVGQYERMLAAAPQAQP